MVNEIDTTLDQPEKGQERRSVDLINSLTEQISALKIIVGRQRDVIKTQDGLIKELEKKACKCQVNKDDVTTP
jgi:hypothetical protein